MVVETSVYVCVYAYIYVYISQKTNPLIIVCSGSWVANVKCAC